MSHHLIQQAIALALSSNWEEAEKINRLIIAENKSDVDALNRLAKACGELGKVKEAMEASKRVLEIDPENKIATKAAIKWKVAKKDNARVNQIPQSSKNNPRMFLEEPGKTKILHLINLCEKKLINLLDSGDGVNILHNGRRITINTLDGKYVGRLPDDISAHLKRLIELGNEYEAFIKTATEKEVGVFIRETKRGSKAKDITSFPSEKINYIPFARSSLQSPYPE